MIREASCCCGQLVVTCQGEVRGSSICHCFACQQRTGSAFGVQVRYPQAQVTARGRSTVYRRKGDEGEGVVFHFCPDCGSTVYWELGGMPDSVIVAVGAFCEPGFPPPVFSVYEDRMHPWVALPESVEEHMA